ncbi:MAG: VOC family protein [Candidatus Hodarchaeota archaeon]
MPRVVHFDIDAEDTNRAMKFYSNVFGWKFNYWEGPTEYWLIKTGGEEEPGINGGLSKREEAYPKVILTIGVPSRDEFAKKIEETGGKILDKMAVPGVGWFALCSDTEGNEFGIMEDDESAK